MKDIYGSRKTIYHVQSGCWSYSGCNNNYSLTLSEKITAGYFLSVSLCRILNNMEWYKNVDAVDFLGNVGRHIRMGGMLLKDRWDRESNKLSVIVPTSGGA